MLTLHIYQQLTVRSKQDLVWCLKLPHTFRTCVSGARSCSSYSCLSVQVAVKPPMAVTNAVSWRSEGIKYKKNEVFLDVVESVNLLVNSNGTVVRSEVVGALKMRTFLSGMPECKLGLNDKVLCPCSVMGHSMTALGNPSSSTSTFCLKPSHLAKSLLCIERYCIGSLHRSVYNRNHNWYDFWQVLFEAQGRGGKSKAVDLEDMKFHQCVRLARFDNDRTISFIPPDGAFDLM